MITHFSRSQDRLFGKMALDVDRRVRLATQSAHRLIVTVAKRKIAPYLKSMAGPWIACFFDPSKDVARTATTTFTVRLQPKISSLLNNELLTFILVCISL